MRHLRDHYDGGTVHRPGRKDGDPEAWSICMHPGPGMGATAASMVAELPRDAGVLAAAWCALATPCTGAFLPIPFPPTGALPGPLTTGTGEPDRASAWWRMKALGDAVMEDPIRWAPVVQAEWQVCEQAWRDASGDLTARVDDLLSREARLRRVIA